MATTQGPPSSRVCVGDELEQSAIGIAEVDAQALALRAGAAHGSLLDRHLPPLEVLHGLLDRARPFKAEVAVAGLHRQLCERAGLDAGTVHVQLLAAEPV